MRNRTYGGVRGRKTKVGRKLLRFPPTRFMISVSFTSAFLARSPRLQLLEEVVALIIYEDECREVLYGNLPDSLHTELRVLYALDALDRTLRENGSYTTDSTEVETTMLLASLCNNIATVTPWQSLQG